MSNAEDTLATMIRWAKLPPPEREYKFHPTRKWRFDFAWPTHRLAVEVEGGLFTQGRHSRGRGMMGDMDKYSAAALHGWMVLRVSANEVKRAATLLMIERGLLVQRVWSRTERMEDGCWLWRGAVTPNGYGVIRTAGRIVYVHRQAWEASTGLPIPVGLDIDHLCHNRSDTCAGGRACLHRRCVRTDHLQPSTRSDNLRRVNQGNERKEGP